MSYTDFMVELTRKQRELRQREDLIVEVARRLLLDRGYHGLTMDRIAETIEYSKGTVYQHFPCKEEVLTELATRILRKRLAMFEHAATFQGRTRERMVAIGEAAELFMRLYPDHLLVVQIIRTEVIAQKVSPERLAAMKGIDYRVVGIMTGIVRDAIAQGDLVLPPGASPEGLPFGLWSLTDGGYAAILPGMSFHDIGIEDPFLAVMRNCEMLGDGYQWRPLSADWDYAATRARIRATIFAEETRKLKAG